MRNMLLTSSALCSALTLPAMAQTTVANDQQLQAALNSGATSIQLQSGNYSPINVTNSNVTIAAAPGATPVINVGQSDGFGINIPGSNVTIQGITVQGDAQSLNAASANAMGTTSNGASAGGIQIEGTHVNVLGSTIKNMPGSGIQGLTGADYITIKGNTITGNAHWSGYGTSGVSLWQLRNADNNPGYHNQILNNTLTNNAEMVPEINTPGLIRDGNGIIMDSTNNQGYTGTTLIQGNIVSGSTGQGIIAYDSNGVTITGNTAFGNALSGLDNGQQFSGGTQSNNSTTQGQGTAQGAGGGTVAAPATTTVAAPAAPHPLTSAPSAAPSAVQPSSGFTVSATGGFTAPNGNSWNMRGMNANLLNAGVQDALIGFANATKTFPGMTALRLNVNNPATDPIADITKVMQEYTAKGIVVEIEDHSGKGDNVAWYTQMATTFKNNPLVFLETPNEPTTSAAVTAQNQINIINAIRAAGFTNPIGVQPVGGYNQSNIPSVTAAVGTKNIYVTPHVYYNGTDPNGAASYVADEIKTAKSNGLFPVIDEFGDAIDGYTEDPLGQTTIQAVVDANKSGSAGAIFWAMSQGNQPDSAFTVPGGDTLTADGQKLMSWIGTPSAGNLTGGPPQPSAPTAAPADSCTAASVSANGDGVSASSIGVNTHLNGSNLAATQAALSYLGVTNIRDNLSNLAGNPAPFAALAAQGIKFDLVVPSGDPAQIVSQLAAFETQHPGSIASIEGPNEINLSPVNGSSTSGSFIPAAQFQAALYADIKANPTLTNIPVIDLTSGGAEPNNVGLQYLTVPPGTSAAVAASTKFADIANVHVYTDQPMQEMAAQYGQTWASSFPGYSSAQLEALPKAITETGASTAEMSDAAQATYITDMAKTAASQGFGMVYFYDLLNDDALGGKEAQYGLFNSDGTPKPAATALKTLIAGTATSCQPISSPIATTAPVSVPVADVPAPAPAPITPPQSWSCPSSATGATTFTVAGSSITGPNGQWSARGVNVRASDLASSASAIVSTFPGVNFIRVDVGNYSDANSLSSTVSQLTSQGIVVDLADYSNSSQAAAVVWAKQMASSYGANPYVWIEPSPHSQNAATQAIRGAGDNNPVIMQPSASAPANSSQTIWDGTSTSGPSLVGSYGASNAEAVINAASSNQSGGAAAWLYPDSLVDGSGNLTTLGQQTALFLNTNIVPLTQCQSDAAAQQSIADATRQVSQQQQSQPPTTAPLPVAAPAPSAPVGGLAPPQTTVQASINQAGQSDVADALANLQAAQALDQSQTPNQTEIAAFIQQAEDALRAEQATQ